MAQPRESTSVVALDATVFGGNCVTLAVSVTALPRGTWFAGVPVKVTRYVVRFRLIGRDFISAVPASADGADATKALATKVKINHDLTNRFIETFFSEGEFPLFPGRYRSWGSEVFFERHDSQQSFAPLPKML